MSGTIRLAAPGAQTEELLASAIGRAQAADRLAPVTVVGRSSAVNLDLRRRLAGRGPVAGLRFTLLPRLVEQLGAPSLAASAVAGLPGVGPRAPLGRPMLGAAVRVALRERPGVLAPVVEHPSTEASVTKARAAASKPIRTPAMIPSSDVTTYSCGHICAGEASAVQPCQINPAA